MTWFETEKLEGALRQKLKKQLENYRNIDSCPLLIDDACCIYPMRSLACRHFNATCTPCADGEDAFQTLPGCINANHKI